MHCRAFKGIVEMQKSPRFASTLLLYSANIIWFTKNKNIEKDRKDFSSYKIARDTMYLSRR